MAVSKKSKRAQGVQGPDAEAFARLLDSHDPIVVAKAFQQACSEWRRTGGRVPSLAPADVVAQRPEVREPSAVGRLVDAGRIATFKQEDS